MTIQNVLQTAVTAADDKKALNIVALDMRDERCDGYARRDGSDECASNRCHRG